VFSDKQLKGLKEGRR